jgi:hypothetical protein
VEKEGGQVAISEWSTGIFSLESNFVDFYIHCSTGRTRVSVVRSDIHPLLPEPPGSDQLRAPVKTRCGIDQKGYMRQAVTLRSPLALARRILPASSSIPSALLHRSFPLPPESSNDLPGGPFQSFRSSVHSPGVYLLTNLANARRLEIHWQSDLTQAFVIG